jgi:hypothetical protein
MDWFERLTGFKEDDYAKTQSRLRVEGHDLVSNVNGKRYGIGSFELVSLQVLRERVAALPALPGKLRSCQVSGDVRKLHQSPEYAGALFQVASQFNCLEMVSPSVTPEQGVTRYDNDRTQGPACAVAAGAATIFRNYFVPLGDQIGQTNDCQLDGLADLGQVLSKRLNMPVSDLWVMANGYALCTQSGLAAIEAHLDALSPCEINVLQGQLRIGLHEKIELTDALHSPRRFVSHAYCSALPVAYSSICPKYWALFAQLILDAAYEATLLAGVLHAQRGSSNIIALTRLGGGAFGNDRLWIDRAIQRSLKIFTNCDLDVRIISYR